MINIIKVLLMGLALSAASYGPYTAEVLSVYDGDTFTAAVDNWPGSHQETRVRIRGIDAPEIRTRSLCEKRLAVVAKRVLSQLLVGEVELRNIKRDKYYGRVDADVFVNGASVAQQMIGRGHARPYSGGKRQPWCVQ